MQTQTPAEALDAFAVFTGLPLPEDPRQAVLKLRRAIAHELDHMLAVLDSLEGDPDLEPAGDDEPSLGWTELQARNGNYTFDARDDREDETDADDTAPESEGRGFRRCGPDDYELSALETHGRGFFVLSGHDDAEEDDPAGDDVLDEPHDENTDEEPSLGWTLAEAETGEIAEPDEIQDGEVDETEASRSVYLPAAHREALACGRRDAQELIAQANLLRPDRQAISRPRQLLCRQPLVYLGEDGALYRMHDRGALVGRPFQTGREG